MEATSGGRASTVGANEGGVEGGSSGGYGALGEEPAGAGEGGGSWGDGEQQDERRRLGPGGGRGSYGGVAYGGGEPGRRRIRRKEADKGDEGLCAGQGLDGIRGACGGCVRCVCR